MLTVKGDVGWNDAARDGRKTILRLVELVVDLADPAESSRHHKIGAETIVVGQDEPSSFCRLILHAIQRVRRSDEISRWAAIKAVIAEGVAPLAVMQALRRGQILVNGKAPDMLNMRIDKGSEASVAVKTSDIRVREVLQKACRIWTDTGRRDDIQQADPYQSKFVKPSAVPPGP